jgi:predicted lipoprotein with Yx(FWY)xxD motif
MDVTRSHSIRGALRAVAAGAILAAALVACGDGDSQSRAAETTGGVAATSSAERSDATASRRKGASVKVIKSSYGRILFDGRGRALYLFTRERGSACARCYADCAAAWPPFLTRGKPRASSGVSGRLLGTTKRRDGKTQVTYAGQPLYYYVGDRRPGEVKCQDVDEFGGTWLVVSPSGSAVR